MRRAMGLTVASAGVVCALALAPGEARAQQATRAPQPRRAPDAAPAPRGAVLRIGAPQVAGSAAPSGATIGVLRAPDPLPPLLPDLAPPASWPPREVPRYDPRERLPTPPVAGDPDRNTLVAVGLLGVLITIPMTALPGMLVLIPCNPGATPCPIRTPLETAGGAAMLVGGPGAIVGGVLFAAGGSPGAGVVGGLVAGAGVLQSLALAAWIVGVVGRGARAPELPQERLAGRRWRLGPSGPFGVALTATF